MSVQLTSTYPQRYLTLSVDTCKGTDTTEGLAGTSCHRCGESMTVYVAGYDYCRKCTADIRAREAQDARRVDRFARAKDLTYFDGAA